MAAAERQAAAEYIAAARNPASKCKRFSAGFIGAPALKYLAPLSQILPVYEISFSRSLYGPVGAVFLCAGAAWPPRGKNKADHTQSRQTL